VLLNFESVKRFKNWSDLSKFGSYRELETTELRLRKVTKEGVTVIKFGVNERGCDGASSEKVESVSYPLKIVKR